MADTDVLIVGAGPAGLACGLRLREIGIPFRIVEASDGVGGRVRTDEIDGFRLDRGFQVLLPAAPEVERTLDYGPLDLKPFKHADLIRFGGRFHRFADPRSEPWTAVKSLFGPIGTLRDKLRLSPLVSKVKAGKVEDQFRRPEGLTLDFLRWGGRFSETMIDRYFRPYCGCLFLDRDLVTSSRLFRFVLRALVEGGAAVPAAGMGAIPAQLAARLPADAVRLNAAVETVEPGKVVLRGGEETAARAVVVATDGPTAARLLPNDVRDPGSRAVTCVYFAADESPVKEPVLLMNADEPGPVNHLAVLSDVAPSYAPPGAALISASILGDPATDDAALAAAVREQLTGWFGPAVAGWRHLRTYRIRHALPDQSAPALDEPAKPARLDDGLYVCGDHRGHAGLDGALASGWRAAQAVAEDLDAGAV
ncbi:MAG TPA: NAD(P)/FAD-dependent oxidoreductase [Gemmataceae bacterium]|jgi:phytoene dehydrogenase-like protein